MRRFLLVGLLLLAACGGAEEATEREAAPEPESEPEVAEPIILEPEEAEETEEEGAVEDEEFYRIPDKALTDVSCGGDALTFTITNTVDKKWSLDILSFPPPKDTDSLRITINGHNPWKPGQYFTGASLRDCTDAIIEPGDTFTCTVKPIPIIKQNPYSQNTIQAQANRINEQKHFACEG